MTFPRFVHIARLQPAAHPSAFRHAQRQNHATAARRRGARSCQQRAPAGCARGGCHAARGAEPRQRCTAVSWRERAGSSRVFDQGASTATLWRHIRAKYLFASQLLTCCKSVQVIYPPCTAEIGKPAPDYSGTGARLATCAARDVRRTDASTTAHSRHRRRNQVREHERGFELDDVDRAVVLPKGERGSGTSLQHHTHTRSARTSRLCAPRRSSPFRTAAPSFGRSTAK